MARTPPKRGHLKAVARKPIDPRVTAELPDLPEAVQTWTGAPTRRTANARWSGQVNFAGRKHPVPTCDTPRQWGIERDKVLVELRECQQNGEPLSDRTELDRVTIREFAAAPRSAEGWPYGFTGSRGKRVREQ